jgi:hypothetical protein
MSLLAGIDAIAAKTGFRNDPAARAADLGTQPGGFFRRVFPKSLDFRD